MELINLTIPKTQTPSFSQVRTRLHKVKHVMRSNDVLMPLGEFLELTETLRYVIVEVEEIQRKSITCQGIHSYSMDKRLSDVNSKLLRIMEIIKRYIS